MIITHHREKLINAILYFATNTKYCGMIKILKLLYFLDFTHFKQTGKSVTGLKYEAWEMGPVPKELYNEIDERMRPDLYKAINVIKTESIHKIYPKKKPDATYFTPRELSILEKLVFIFKDAKAEEMSEISHLENEPWDKTKREKGLFKEIDYMLAIDGRNGSLSHKEAKERSEEISEMHKIFGTI